MRFSTVAASLLALVTLVSATPKAEAVPEGTHQLDKRAPAAIYSKCKTAKTVALTFDDGPYIYDTALLNQLAKYKVKATFFVNGNNWECGYDNSMISSMRALYKAGHEFGSHTWRHTHLANQTWDKIHDEMYKTELLLNRVLGVQPAMMRPPYGEYNDLVRSASGTRNQSIILWDFDSGDSTGKTANQTIALYQSTLNKKPNNLLPLNHSVKESTVNTVIPAVLKMYTTAGYKFSTVSECLGIKPYQWTKAQGVKDSTWHC